MIVSYAQDRYPSNLISGMGGWRSTASVNPHHWGVRSIIYLGWRVGDLRGRFGPSHAEAPLHISFFLGGAPTGPRWPTTGSAFLVADPYEIGFDLGYGPHRSLPYGTANTSGTALLEARTHAFGGLQVAHSIRRRLRVNDLVEHIYEHPQAPTGDHLAAYGPSTTAHGPLSTAHGPLPHGPRARTRTRHEHRRPRAGRCELGDTRPPC